MTLQFSCDYLGKSCRHHQVLAFLKVGHPRNGVVSRSTYALPHPGLGDSVRLHGILPGRIAYLDYIRHGRVAFPPSYLFGGQFPATEGIMNPYEKHVVKSLDELNVVSTRTSIRGRAVAHAAKRLLGVPQVSVTTMWLMTHVAAIGIVIALATPAGAINKSWVVDDGFWANPANWSPVGVPAAGDDVLLGNLPGVQNSTVSLGAAGLVQPENVTVSDGMTLRTDSSGIWAGLRVRVEGSNLVGGGGGFATLFRSTLRLDGLLKANSLLTDFLEIADGGQLVLEDYATAQVFGQMVIDATSTAQGTGSISFNNSGRTLANDGTIRAGSGQGLTIRQQELTDGRLDLDGDFGQGRLDVPAGRTLTFVDDELNDSFSGQISLDSGADLRMFIANGWTADAQSSIDIAGSIVGLPSELNGQHFTFGGTMSIAGDLAWHKVIADATLLPTANFHVSEGDRISFLGETTVHGGSIQTLSGNPQNGHVEFAGATNWDGNVIVDGSLVQTGEATVSGPSVVNATTVDLDGPIGNQTVWNINNLFVVNADSIDGTVGNVFFGTMNIAGGFLPKLTLNLTDPGDHWGMNGTMNLMGDPGIFLERLAGSRMDSFGDVTVTSGRVQISADTRFWSGTLDIGPAGAILRMTGQTLLTSQVEVNGQGTLRNGTNGQLTLSHMASLDDVGLVNDGLLLIGIEAPGIASVDRFTSSASATWQLDIGGYVLGDEFDHLVVTDQPASLDGLLEVLLFDDGDGIFLPQIGDEFTILTAISGVTGQFINSPVSSAAGMLFHWSVLYHPNDVTLVLADVTPALPEPTSAVLLALGMAIALHVAHRAHCRVR